MRAVSGDVCTMVSSSMLELEPTREAVWPRIALVTPAYNSVKYIEATIRSVLAQDYPNLDYFIVDGGSTDGTGEIMGWVSATDVLQWGGLAVVGSVFRGFPEVEWITGRPTALNEEGMTTEIARLRRFSRWRFLAGANQHVQQESTYWRRSLWE